MLAQIDPSILVAMIGTPAALITAIGTVWFVSRKPATGSKPVPTGPSTYPMNGQNYVTKSELKDIVAEMKDEMRDMERRQEAKFDLIVALLKDR